MAEAAHHLLAAELVHLPQDPFLAAAQVGARGLGPEPARAGQDRGQEGRLGRIEGGGRAPEELARGRLHPVDPVAEFDDVQVDLEDPPLGPGRLQQEREVDLETLARPGAGLPQEQVLGGLLGEGGGADVQREDVRVAVAFGFGGVGVGVERRTPNKER